MTRLRDLKPEDAALPAEADGYLRHNPDDAKVREARERLPELSTRVSDPALLGSTGSTRSKEK